MSSECLPAGKDAAKWLFARLTHHRWSTNRGAPDAVINELHVPILRSAVLRSLRLVDRPDLIEEQLRHADSAWFAMKCLQERSRAGARDGLLAARLKETLLDQSSFSDNVRLKRVVEEIDFSISNAAAPNRSHEKQGIVEPPPTRVRYQDIIDAVSDVDRVFKPAPPLVLGPVSAEEFSRLVQLLDPINDRSNAIEKFLPAVQFTATGYLASRRTSSSTGVGDPVRTILRPVIAAANQSGSVIAWHGQLMGNVFAATYAPVFLACLSARGDSSGSTTDST